MIEPNLQGLSVGKRCALPSISRSSFYDDPKGESEVTLDPMCVSDKKFLETPFYGVRRMTWRLRDEDHPVNEKRIGRLMPIYRKPNTSKAAKGHKIYPYPLRGLRVDRPDQVRCADITCLPMRRGFLYLAAIMDRYTRKVLAWRISNTPEADFRVEALNEAVHKSGLPQIMNTDRGSQFTSFVRTDCDDPVFVSQWMARGGFRITSSLNGCGGLRNTNASIRTPSRPAQDGHRCPDGLLQ